MKTEIESAAAKNGVPLSVLDLIGQDFISQIIEELPNLLLPPIMETLSHSYQNGGVVWIEQNVLALKNHFTTLRQMYGFEEDERVEKPMQYFVAQ